MTSEIVPAGEDLLQRAVDVYLAGLAPTTQANYESRISAFLEWRAEQDPEPVIAQLKRYVAHLKDERGLAARTIQAHISTLKGLVRTAAALDPRLTPFLPQLELVAPPKRRGQFYGTRLSGQELRQLLAAPDATTVKGLRDVAILGLLAICGLRRSEVCALTWGHLWILEGYPAIRDLVSKHGRVRTVKMPRWLWTAIYEWGGQSGVDYRSVGETVFRPMHKSGEVLDRDQLSDDAIYELVQEYALQAGLPDITPHDLRRTAAALAKQGGAATEQIQVMLGHEDPKTTRAYIGDTLDLDDHAVDYIDVAPPNPRDGPI